MNNPSTSAALPVSNSNREVQIAIDDQVLPWQQLFAQLQLFGRLTPFIREVVTQRILMEEIARRSDLTIDALELEEAIAKFRNQAGLEDELTLQGWLKQEHLDFSGLRNRLFFALKVEKLKQRIAEPQLEQEFREQAPSLEKVELSYCLCPSEAEAHHWFGQLTSGGVGFEDLAVRDDLPEDMSVKAPAAALRRSWLPEALRERLSSDSIGVIQAPEIVRDNRWIIARLDRIIPVIQDDALNRQLSEGIFKRWLQEQLSSRQVRVSESSDTLSDTGAAFAQSA